ncbi:MAG: menaquinone biosynthesis protein [Verrucomicrobiota bacterium]
MDDTNKLPKLRLAARETIEEMTRRVDRQQRAEGLQRESRLENSLAPFRVGSVPHLNAAPLTRGLEDQILYAPPSQLAELLRNDQLDAALISVTEVLFSDRYDVLDGVAIGSLGEVKSVFLAHRKPLESLREVYCDTASLTSVNLLKVILAERGLHPEYKPLPDYESASNLDAVMLIGDHALNFLFSGPPHEILDLGAAWSELTSLPFVYAVWALRRGVENEKLRRILLEAKDFGLDTMETLLLSRNEYDYDFRKDYLTWHIHYHFGTDERCGLNKFAELLQKHQQSPIYPIHFVA